MTNMSQDLLAQLSGAPLQEIAGKLGLSTEQTQTAVSNALPLLMGALGKNASQPQGAEALLGALGRDHAQSGGVADMLGSALAGGSANGAGILGHIFGGQQGQAEAQLGQATGIGGDKASMLMKILAPIVMGYLAKRVLGGNGNGQNAAAGGVDLAGLLGGGGGSAGLTSMLDQDGDGQLGLSDVLKVGGQLFGQK